MDNYLLDYWKNSYYLKEGKVELLTGTEKELVGKVVNMRVPQFCQTSDGNFCKCCLGKALGSVESGVSSEVVDMPTTFMLIKMKNAHVSKVDTMVIPLEELLG